MIHVDDSLPLHVGLTCKQEDFKGLGGTITTSMVESFGTNAIFAASAGTLRASLFAYLGKFGLLGQVDEFVRILLQVVKFLETVPVADKLVALVRDTMGRTGVSPELE